MQEHLDTKENLAEACKRLTHKKSFDKITIADITQESGYNRQTFYYHFRDKYELLSWIYTHDAMQVYDEHLSFENWHRYLTALLHHMRREKEFYINTIRCDASIFQHFLFQLMKSLFHRAISDLDQYHQINEVEKNFYSEFYSFGITGVIIRWVQNDMKESAERVTANLKSLAMDSEKMAYSRYRKAYMKTQNKEDV